MKRSICLFFLLLVPSFLFAGVPDSYYESTQGLSGQELKAALHKIIDGQKVYRYTVPGNSNKQDWKKVDVWEALVYTDSACPDADPQCGMVKMLYLDEARHIEERNKGKGGHDVWDREHVWPKSRGFRYECQAGYTGLHHIRPADRNINGTHNNYGYDEGGKPVLDKHDDGSAEPSGAYIDR